MPAPANTVDLEEIEHFSRIATEWWNPEGKFKPLHIINPLRIGYIKDQAQKHFSLAESTTPLQGLKLLDIGCGGGLIAEPMSRLGASVTGIDASEKNITTASLHAQQSGLAIDYRCIAAENLNEQFDIVLALEIVEHVSDIPAFVAATCKLVKPGGLIIYSTINRTAKSYALAIVGAEYILNWVPRGTHHWKKFLKPSELSRELRASNICVTHMTGMVMNPVSWKWRLDERDLDVNYLVTGTSS